MWKSWHQSVWLTDRREASRQQNIPKSIITPSNWPLQNIYENNKKGPSWLWMQQWHWRWFNALCAPHLPAPWCPGCTSGPDWLGGCTSHGVFGHCRSPGCCRTMWEEPAAWHPSCQELWHGVLQAWDAASTDGGTHGSPLQVPAVTKVSFLNLYKEKIHD